MNTIEVCEHLLFKIPDLRKSFCSLKIIDNNRQISPKFHEEFDKIFKDFKKPKIVCAIGIIQTIFIIETSVQIRRKYPVIQIIGENCQLLFISKSGLYTYISNELNIKDFLPNPLTRKIIYIQDFRKMEGIVFSEYSKNLWTINDPLLIEPKNTNKITMKQLILEITADIGSGG